MDKDPNSIFRRFDELRGMLSDFKRQLEELEDSFDRLQQRLQGNEPADHSRRGQVTDGPRPKDGWDKWNIVATVFLAAAGVAVAFAIGKGQISTSTRLTEISKSESFRNSVVAMVPLLSSPDQRTCQLAVVGLKELAIREPEASSQSIYRILQSAAQNFPECVLTAVGQRPTGPLSDPGTSINILAKQALGFKRLAEGDLTTAEQLAREILQVDSTNGHGLYLLAETYRRGKQVAKATDELELYLTQERSIPEEAKGEGKPKGYWDERTAFVALLLADTYSSQARSRKEQHDPNWEGLASRACDRLKLSLQKRPQGFTTPIATSAIASRLGNLGSRCV